MVSMEQIRERMPAISAWIQAEIDAGHTPGAAVGIIANGEVVFTGGFGLRDVAQGLPVDVDTLFAIGSCTKAFTAFGAGLLVDEGKITWDTPVRDVLPEFRLYDPIATQLCTFRDLLCHRTGLARHDLVWYGTNVSRETLVSRLRHLQPNLTFRERWQYQNLMYMTAGYSVGKAANATWEAFTQSRILDPLEMKRSQFSVNQSEQDANAALPYTFDKAGFKTIPFRNIDAIGPAGSINSNVEDMLRWLHVNMYGKAGLIAEVTLREQHSPQVVIADSPEFPWYGTADIMHTGYGLGWATLVYRGMRQLRHAGGIDGFNASVAFLPDHSLGVVVLCNTQERDPASVITYGLFDRLLGIEPLAWWDRFTENREKLEAQAAAQQKAFIDARQDNAPPSHPLEAYVGVYRHAGYGDFTFQMDDQRLMAVFNGLTMAVTPHHFDTFLLELEGAAMLLVGTFFNNARGKVARFAIALEGTISPLEFVYVENTGS